MDTCFNRSEVTPAKFNTGDKVRFTKRVPDFIASDLRRRTRTIVAMSYEQDKQCCYYQLGERGNGTLGYAFRAYMLHSVNGDCHSLGRPRTKRAYRHKAITKVLISSPEPNLGGFIAS